MLMNGNDFKLREALLCVGGLNAEQVRKQLSDLF